MTSLPAWIAHHDSLELKGFAFPNNRRQLGAQLHVVISAG